MNSYKETENLLKGIDPKHFFYLNTGYYITSVEGLLQALESMDDMDFRHHVNEKKNDFSRWINQSLKDKGLAAMITGVKDKAKMIELLRNEIDERKKIEEKIKRFNLGYHELENDLVKKDHELQSTFGAFHLIDDKVRQMRGMIKSREQVLEKKYNLIKDLEEKIKNDEENLIDRKNQILTRFAKDERDREKLISLNNLLIKKEEKLKEKEQKIDEKEESMMNKNFRLEQDLIDHEKKVIKLNEKEAETNRAMKDKEMIVREREALIRDNEIRLKATMKDYQKKIEEIKEREDQLIKNETLLFDAKRDTEKKLILIKDIGEDVKEEEERIKKLRSSWDDEEKSIIIRLKELKEEIKTREKTRDNIDFEITRIKLEKEKIKQKENELNDRIESAEEEKQMFEKKRMLLRSEKKALERKEQHLRQEELDISLQKDSLKEKSVSIKNKEADVESKKRFMDEDEKEFNKKKRETERKIQSMESQIELIRDEKREYKEHLKKIDEIRRKVEEKHSQLKKKEIELSRKEAAIEKRESEFYERKLQEKRDNKIKELQKADMPKHEHEENTKPKNEKISSILQKIKLLKKEDKQGSDADSKNDSKDMLSISSHKNINKLIGRVKHLINSDDLKKAKSEYKKLKDVYDKMGDNDPGKMVLFYDIIEIYDILK